MTALSVRPVRRHDRRSPRSRAELAIGGVLFVVVVGVVSARPAEGGALLVAAVAAIVAVAAALRDPVVALLLAMTADFLVAATPSTGLPVAPVTLALALTVVSVWLAVGRGELVWPRPGAAEAVMVAYVAWNLASIVAPHRLAAPATLSGEPFSLSRYLFYGTIAPFVLYVLGRVLAGSPRAVRALLWWMVGVTAYSAAVSIMPFHGLSAFVFPRYIVTAPGWPDRAVGVMNQPVVNGLVLVIGVAVCFLLTSRPETGRRAAVCLWAVAAAALYGIYLTHTRAPWAALVLVALAGAVLARGFRRGFVAVIAAVVVTVVATWAALASSDRAAGGVGSGLEIADRFNMIATGVWAVAQHPIAGWGLGRFAVVNTDDHRQWSSAVDWERGYGLVSHENEIGIATELGLVGLALWLAVLVLVVRRVWATRSGPGGVATDRDTGPGAGFATIALLAFLAFETSAVTADVRFLDLAGCLTFLVAGLATRSSPATRGVGVR